MFETPPLLTASFIAVVLLVCGCVIAAIANASGRRAAIVSTIIFIIFLASSHQLAASGKLSNFTAAPPPIMRLWLVEIIGALVFAFSRFGKQVARETPSWLLAGFQGFRIAIELFLHQLYQLHLIPIEMTWSGRNFDILSGVLGLMLAIYTYRRLPPRWLLVAYNILGILLVANIAAVSVLCAPGPLRHYFSDPANTLPAHAPWVWITLMVTLALLGHLLFLRKLATK